MNAEKTGLICSFGTRSYLATEPRSPERFLITRVNDLRSIEAAEGRQTLNDLRSIEAAEGRL